jgi:hypothetical protein
MRNEVKHLARKWEVAAESKGDNLRPGQILR